MQRIPSAIQLAAGAKLGARDQAHASARNGSRCWSKTSGCSSAIQWPQWSITPPRTLPPSRCNEAIAKTFKLPMPVLALSGNNAWGRRMEVLESLQRVASNVRGGVIDHCGHWMPEEQPAVLLQHLLPFLAEA